MSGEGGGSAYLPCHSRQLTGVRPGQTIYRCETESIWTAVPRRGR
jgi:hypothetical protein